MTKKYIADNIEVTTLDNFPVTPNALPTADYEIANKKYVDDNGGVTDHGALTGLSDDDHVQYALLAGRSGGQTLIGGSDASDDITIESTSNATKGVIYLDDPTYLNTPMWDDISFGTTSLSTGVGSNPDIGVLDSTTIDVALFAGTVTLEEVSGVLEIPHKYANGTDLIPHIHWYATTADAGNVKWQLEYAFVDVSTGGTVTGSTTIDVTDATPTTAWKLVTTDFPTISGTGIELGDQIHFKLFRDPNDASDTYEEDVATATFGFHYQVDSFGSAQVSVK